MTRSRNKLIIAIVVNTAVFLFEVWAIWCGVMKNGPAENFMYYTELSNLFACIVCAVCAVAEFRLLRQGAGADAASGGDAEPGGGASPGAAPGAAPGSGSPGTAPDEGFDRTLSWMKYAASCCLLMTLFVVTFVLTPMLENAGYAGFYLMFVDGAKPVTHLGAPLVVTASYILFEADRSMTLKQSLIGFAPTLAYAAVAYPCNILSIWDGPYPFFQVWNMEPWASVLWFIALFFLAFGLCQIPRLLARGRTGR